MNKLAIFSCLSLMAVSAVAETHDIEIGSIGVTKITSSLKNTIVAVSFADLEAGGEIKVADLVRTDNLTAGDQLAVFNGNTYDTWTLQGGAWVKNDMTFTQGSDGLLEGTGTAADEATKVVGTGFWLIRNNDYTEGTEFTFYVFGKPVTSPTSSVPAKTVSLIGNPTQNDIELIAEKITGVTVGDRIHLPQAGGFKVYTYGEKGWYTFNESTKLYAYSNPTIPAGKGVWYLSVGENTVTITW